MKENFIQINGISKHFGTVKAVDDVSFSIKEGEFFSLLGPSGCGKTTLLRLLAGFEFPSNGNLFIDGSDITALPPDKRPTNMVFQNYAIFPHINVEQNIKFGLRKLGLTDDEIKKRVNDVLTLVKLEGYEERFSGQLSGGQRQRVALARALVRQPKVLLLDEPLGALDKKLRDEMQLELRTLQKEIGITFVFVTHDQQEAISMSDRVAVMSDGKIQQLSAPNELYKNPENIFVSNFIGETNFLTASTKSKDGESINVTIEDLGDFKIKNNLNIPENSSDVVCSVRPESMMISRDKSDWDICLEAKINQTSYLGEMTKFYVEVSGINKVITVSSQHFDNQSFENNNCFISISLEDISLLQKK
jgi:spermidine/putrescine ABC transporter ATP-binding subunit